ncbi:MAG: hypothetical protein V7L14_09010 [Nostoc sp.]|uniref:hypothetical protein n=1 Tax=Nostoc sp. TaxID=1180 RepID=UPI002FFCCF06
MKVTVKELIEKLHDYSPDAEVVIEDLDDDQEFFIDSFSPRENVLTIVITDQEEEEDIGQPEDEGSSEPFEVP